LTVRIAADEGEILLTGDTAFSAEGMDPCAPTAGIHVDVRAVRDLHRRLGGRGACLLPSHDPGNADRLEALVQQ
jgi:glyoxylase-like metal-dependent hydrolase (beta-lactamase superfamily II)